MKIIPNSVTVPIARAALKTQQASPKLLFVGGIVGMGATVVLACRATLKVEKIIDHAEIALEDTAELRNEAGGDRYSEKDYRKDRVHIYTTTALDLAKLYGPAIFVGSVSVAMLVGSHNTLSRRNAGLVAAYGTLDRAFSNYRARVEEAYGKEREQEIYHDVLPCEIDDPNDGRKKKHIKVANGGSPYARLFEPTNVNWEPTPEHNFLFLKSQQKYANQRLQARGHVFLNEVLDDLGLPRCPEGAVVGWVKGKGDNYVDFGIFNAEYEDRVIDFMTGREDSIWLDFNVDGVMWDQI